MLEWFSQFLGMSKCGCKSCEFSLIGWKIGVIVFSEQLFSAGDFFFLEFLNFILFFMQRVLISYPFNTY